MSAKRPIASSGPAHGARKIRIMIRSVGEYGGRQTDRQTDRLAGTEREREREREREL